MSLNFIGQIIKIIPIFKSIQAILLKIQVFNLQHMVIYSLLAYSKSQITNRTNTDTSVLNIFFHTFNRRVGSSFY